MIELDIERMATIYRWWEVDGNIRYSPTMHSEQARQALQAALRASAGVMGPFSVSLLSGASELPEEGLLPDALLIVVPFRDITAKPDADGEE